MIRANTQSDYSRAQGPSQWDLSCVEKSLLLTEVCKFASFHCKSTLRFLHRKGGAVNSRPMYTTHRRLVYTSAASVAAVTKRVWGTF